MKNASLVSVIMPAYNAEDFIEDAIQSVINQHHENWELWVVDDASTDKTWLRIQSFLTDPRIHLIKNKKNQGTAIARNFGIKEAKGKYIAFLDADDLWFPEKLTEQIRFMEEHKQNMCFSSYRLMSENGELLPEIIEALPQLSYQKLLKSNYVGNLTGIYNANVLGKIYAPQLRKRQDWGLWLKVLEKNGTTKGILKPLAAYRVRKNSISNNKFGLVKYNFLVYKKALHFSTFKSMRKMLVFFREHFFIKKKQRKLLK